jgi:hypothetical protein
LFLGVSKFGCGDIDAIFTDEARCRGKEQRVFVWLYAAEGAGGLVCHGSVLSQGATTSARLSKEPAQRINLRAMKVRVRRIKGRFKGCEPGLYLAKFITRISLFICASGRAQLVHLFGANPNTRICVEHVADAVKAPGG